METFDRDKFLAALEKSGEPVWAAREVGTTRAAVRRLRKEDQGFDDRYRDAMAFYRATLAREMHRRGVEGIPGAPVFNPKTGEMMDSKSTEYSDRLLLAHIRRHVPGYREKLTATVRRKVDLEELDDLDPEDRAALEKLLEKALAKKKRKKED